MTNIVRRDARGAGAAGQGEDSGRASEEDRVKIGPLGIWNRMHSNGTPISSISVASLHWPWSLTWRWTVTKGDWYRPPGNQGFSFMRTHRGRGFNFHACFNSRWTGHWSIQTQPNMRSR